MGEWLDTKHEPEAVLCTDVFMQQYRTKIERLRALNFGVRSSVNFN
jgi:hypothetical protein